MIKLLVKTKDPKILVITPLKTGSSISQDTKKSLKRCSVPFFWMSYMGDGNPYENTVVPYRWYRKEYGGLPPYVIKIDNDLICQRNMLDKMFETLEESKWREAYAYCPFSYTGKVNVSFDNIEFDVDRLIRSNYISSCSLIKTKVLEETGSFVTDDKYFRLLDWALWLQFLRRGYIGKYVHNTTFTAIAGDSSVSSGSVDNYREKHKNVVDDFVTPYLDKFKLVKDKINEMQKM